MSTFRKYLVPALTVLATGVFIYIFTKLIIYLAISVLLALIGVPVVDMIQRLKFGQRSVPRSIASILTLLTIYFVFFLILLLFIPPVFRELKFISTLNLPDLMNGLILQFPDLKKILGAGASEEELKSHILNYSQEIINLQNVRLLLDNALSIAGSLLAGLLAVSFITFFLLKDKTLLFSTILLLTPIDYEDEMSRILHTTRTMLTKYFTGLLVDTILVSLMVGLTMYFFGIKNAFIIGVFAGLMNVIPYIGPLISMAFALFLGITGCIEYNQVAEIQIVSTKIFFILLAVNLLDGIIIQPFIFSSSVKAHPLEIFIVILMAATVSGVWGMVVAIPLYTLLRIIAKEFFSNSKFFRKLTERII